MPLLPRSKSNLILFLGGFLLLLNGGEHFPINQWLFAGIALCFLINLASTSGLNLSQFAQFWALCSIGILLLSLITTHAIFACSLDVTKGLAYILAGILFLSLFTKPEMRENFINSVILLALVCAAIVPFQAFAGLKIPSLFGWLTTGIPDRWSSFFLNPNYLGECCALGLVLLFIQSTYRQETWTNIKLGVFGFILILAIDLSGSRGALLDAWIPISLFCCFNLKWKQARQPILIMLVLFLLQTSMVTHNKTTVHRMAELQQTTATITTKGEGPRIAIWHAAISLFKEDPILGAGPASFSLRWNQFCPITLQVQAERAHSLWFQTAAEFGITGLILVLVPLLLLAKNIALNPFQKEQTAAAFGVLVMIIHDSIDYSFYTPLIGFIFVGLFTCSWTAETNQQTPRSVRCFLGAVSIGMILFTLCLTKQTYLLERSLQVQDNLDRIKLLTHATQWLPISDNVYYQLGKAWLNEKPPQVEKAKSAFQHAVTLNQYALEPSYALALTLSYQHNPACFQEIARMNALAPTSAKAAALTQLFYTSRGDTNKVAEWIRILDQRLKYKVSNGFPTDNSFSR